MIDAGAKEPADSKTDDEAKETSEEPERWAMELLAFDETINDDGSKKCEWGDGGGHPKIEAEKSENTRFGERMFGLVMGCFEKVEVGDGENECD